MAADLSMFFVSDPHRSANETSGQSVSPPPGMPPQSSDLLHAFIDQPAATYGLPSANLPPSNAVQAPFNAERSSASTTSLSSSPSYSRAAPRSSASSKVSSSSAQTSVTTSVKRPAKSPLPDSEEGEQDSSNSGKKVKITLSADQPLTSHGKPRERVFLACVQCRNRKVRCDGAKPECCNCRTRADPAARPCSYDPAPRRRGKDRTPGSRRLAPFEVKKTRTTRSRVEEEARRRKTEAAAKSAASESFATSAQDIHLVQTPSRSRSVHDVPQIIQQPQAIPSGHILNTSLSYVVPSAASLPFAYSANPIALQDVDFKFVSPHAVDIALRIETEQEQQPSQSRVGTPPGIQFTRETWWDALLTFYASEDAVGPVVMSPDLREVTTQCIVMDLRLLFQITVHWFSFINIPRFWTTLFDPSRRQRTQPSLIIGALALSTFFQSSELERGARGREKALRLLDQARAAFDASLSAGWIDVGLVQAAWLLAMFEIQAHPRAGTPRVRSAFRTLDSIIRSLSLTTLDVDDPRTSVFVPGAVPIVHAHASNSNSTLISISTSVAAPAPTTEVTLDKLEFTNSAYASMFDEVTQTMIPVQPPAPVPPSASGPQRSHVATHAQWHWQCGCSDYSLGSDWPLAAELAPAWTCMPMWPRGVSEGEVQKEECRRLVWATVMLTVSQATKTTAGTDQEPQHLWIKDPSNYALLFPGESLAPHGSGTSAMIPFSKNSVWALYMRTLFLWNSSLRARGDPSLSERERSRFAMTAWLELDRLEAAMDRHTCGIQSGYLMQMREVLFNTRMVVSNDFRRYIPEATIPSGHLFYRDKAERWMGNLLGTARWFLDTMQMTKGIPTGNNRRCFMLYWYMSCIMRALSLWWADPTLTIALEVAKTFAPCVEFMMAIWPSPNQRREYEALRNWLVRSCQIAGVPAPTATIPFVSGPAPHIVPSQPMQHLVDTPSYPLGRAPPWINPANQYPPM